LVGFGLGFVVGVLGCLCFLGGGWLLVFGVVGFVFGWGGWGWVTGRKGGSDPRDRSSALRAAHRGLEDRGAYPKTAPKADWKRMKKL